MRTVASAFATVIIMLAGLLAGGGAAEAATREIANASPQKSQESLESASAVAHRSVGALVLEGIPKVPEALAERLQRYQATRSAILQDWLPDGSLLITTRFGETRQVHRVAEPGGARTQLTFSEEPVSNVVASPDSAQKTFLFTRDVGGSEAYQIYRYALESGSVERLTDGESRNGGMLFAPGGERFAYYSTGRNGGAWHVYVRNLGAEPPTRVVEGEGAWYPEAFSPSGDRLIVVRYVSIDETHPWIVNLATGERRRLFPQAAPAAYHSLEFSKDGEAIYFTSDRDGEFVRLYRKQLGSAPVTAITGDIPWNVEGLEVSRDRRYMAWTVNEGGYSRLFVRRLGEAPGGAREVSLPELPRGVIYDFRFSSDSRRLALVLSRPVSSADVYTVDLGERRVTRWTDSELGGLDAASLVAPELIHYPTFDRLRTDSLAEASGARRSIPAFVYRPRTPGPHPVVIDIHGGPEAQARPSFSASTQFMIDALGVAVIEPNVRGSAGYGRRYHRLDNARRREDAVRDIGALLDWIERQPDLDADRVAVQGGSYGGYMVLAAIARYSDRLRAGIDIVGISNFVTFLTHTRDYRRDLRRQEYGDERDPEMRAFLQSISPANHAERMEAPLLIVQGVNDPRVPASESEQMVAEIRASGGEVWFMLARDEGHGFRKKTNRDFYQAAKALFLERFLLSGG